MNISIVFKKIGYSISFGHDSAVHSCAYWFSITKEYYENKQVVHADWILGWWRHKNFKKPLKRKA